MTSSLNFLSLLLNAAVVCKDEAKQLNTLATPEYVQAAAIIPLTIKPNAHFFDVEKILVK